MIVLDGSKGGGQMVRTALALSSLTGKPFRIINIRGARENPGLKTQHVHAVKALKELCNAKADGDEVGSNELLYIPGTIAAKNHTIDIGTAGSITLLLQAVLLPCMFAQKTHTLTIKGGTDTKWSMPIDYFTHVLIPQYARAAGLDIKTLKRGYYPKGGGEVQVTIRPDAQRKEFDTFDAFTAALTHKALTLTETGHLLTIHGISHASNNLLDSKVAERQADAARNALKHLNVPVTITTEYGNTLSTGSGITLWAIHAKSKDEIDITNPIRLGADALGEPGKPSEQVGTEAAEQLLQELQGNAPVDRHLADNLVPLIGLCRPSTITATELTEHTRINIDVAKAFLGNVYKQKGNTISTTTSPA